MKINWKQYRSNLLVGLDILFNGILFGSPDETISSRLGRWKDGPHPRRRAIAKFICKLLDKIDPGHCDDVERYEQNVPHRPESLENGDKKNG